MTDAFGLGFMVGVGFAFVAIFTGREEQRLRRFILVGPMPCGSCEEMAMESAG